MVPHDEPGRINYSNFDPLRINQTLKISPKVLTEQNGVGDQPKRNCLSKRFLTAEDPRETAEFADVVSFRSEEVVQPILQRFLRKVPKNDDEKAFCEARVFPIK